MSPDHGCQRCTRPVLDAPVCSTCGADLERALAQVAFLEPELDTVLARQSRFGPDSTGSRSAEQTLLVNMAASEAAGHLRAILVGWCRLYAEEAGADLPGNTLTAMSRFLLTRAEWLRHFEAAVDAVNEITDAVGKCMSVIDAPLNRTTFNVGPCPEADEVGPCLGEIRAFIPTRADEPAHMGCTVCGAEYATWQWLRAGRRILDRHAEMGRSA